MNPWVKFNKSIVIHSVARNH